jgi:biopolymer transport protein ExbD
MAYRRPTSRRKVKKDERLNLIPILDAVFIFIFFLLMSAQFVKIFEIGSDVPMVSNEPPPKNQKKPLALTLTINKNSLTLKAGVPSRTLKSFGKSPDGEYDLLSLHDYLVNLKKQNVNENSIIFEPRIDLTYEDIVKIMDSVRMLKKTDDSIFKKDKDGIDVQVQELFQKIVFGNIMS